MPRFGAGTTKVASIVLTNPKAITTSYHAIFAMGTSFTPVAEASFSIVGGGSQTVSFNVTMPTELGVYPVYISIFSNGVLIPPIYRASEDVVVVIPTYVEGIVTDYGTKLPMKDVKVSIAGKIKFTEETGKYKINDIVPGNYTMTFEKIGYDTLVLTSYSCLRGKVTGQNSGLPLEGVKVTASGHVAYSDENGDYILSQIPPGTYVVTYERAFCTKLEL